MAGRTGEVLLLLEWELGSKVVDLWEIGKWVRENC